MGLFSKIGSWVNDLTGATSAAKTQNKYQKEFAQNAHQWEVEDLKKAGLNPILSAGGSGATAGGAGGTTGSSGINPLDMLGQIQSARQTNASIKNINSNTRQQDAITLLTIAQEQGQMLDNAIKAGAKNEIIAQYRANLQETQKRIANISADTVVKKETAKKTAEETQKLKGGKLTEITGTDPLSAITRTGKNAGNWFESLEEKTEKMLHKLFD